MSHYIYVCSAAKCQSLKGGPTKNDITGWKAYLSLTKKYVILLHILAQYLGKKMMHLKVMYNINKN